MLQAFKISPPLLQPVTEMWFVSDSPTDQGRSDSCRVGISALCSLLEGSGKPQPLTVATQHSGDLEVGAGAGYWPVREYVTSGNWLWGLGRPRQLMAVKGTEAQQESSSVETGKWEWPRVHGWRPGFLSAVSYYPKDLQHRVLLDLSELSTFTGLLFTSNPVFLNSLTLPVSEVPLAWGSCLTQPLLLILALSKHQFIFFIVF